MRRLTLFLLLASAGFAAAASAQSCPAPYASSWSRICGGGVCVDGPLPVTGHPAWSTLARHFVVNLSYDLDAASSMLVDYGYFETSAHGTGYTQITSTSNGLGGQTRGLVQDCATVTGGSGAGFLHLPIHVTGEAMVSSLIEGAYVPPPDFLPAGVQLDISCGVVNVGSVVSTPCDGLHYVWDEPTEIDLPVELVWGLTFGQPFSFLLTFSLSGSIGYVANGSTGRLEAMAFGEALGILGPAYVTDAQGAVIPGATIASESGHDYTIPVPEPASPAQAAVVALAALVAWLRRRTSL
jgi:hypothetical protein